MHASDTCGGIVVIISKLFDVLDTSVPLPGRILTITLQHTVTQTEYLFTFYYGLHPQHHPPTELRTAMFLLGQQHSSHTNSFVIGDFNFVELDVDRPSGLNTGDKIILPHWLAFPALLSDAFRVLQPKNGSTPFV